jgi:hypothetical protein
MKITSMMRSKRILIAAGALALGVALNAIPGRAFAGYVICRTDPIVQLSNGNQINITASVSDTASDIQRLAYVVHVPAGLSVKKIVFTGGAVAYKEYVTVYADSAATKYSTATVVTTGRAGIQTSVQTSVQGTSGTATSATVAGTSGQTLTAVLTHS